MSDQRPAMPKPDYRIWLGYFLTPFIIILLSSVVLFVARKRQGIMDWSVFLSQIQQDYFWWQVAFLLVLILPFLIRLCISASKWKMQLSTYKVALSNSLSILKTQLIYLSRSRIDLIFWAIAGAFSALQLAKSFDYEKNITPSVINSDYWLLGYGILILPMLGIVQLWDRVLVAINHALKKSTNTEHFIQSDSPILPSDDLFEWGGKAEAFAKAVLNAEDGTAFGIEAPWGTGKTSFINLCKTHWQAPHTVYRFELLKYAGNQNLIEQFVLGLVDELQKNHYLPELRGAVRGYLAGLQGAIELSGGPLKLTLNNQPHSIDDALAQMRAQLERRLPENSSVIVVIDDLDRVAPESVRELLFALHKSFSLPRLRYVLCFDQEQLSDKAEQHRKNGGDLASQTLYDFLNKFVIARLHLDLPDNAVEIYITKELLPKLACMQDDSSKQWNIFIVTLMKDGLLPLLRAMNEADQLTMNLQANNDNPYTPENTHIHQSILGDIRKFKSFYNQLRLCLQVSPNLTQYDFHPKDLIRLFILRNSFPAVFRTLRALTLSGEIQNYTFKFDYQPKINPHATLFIQNTVSHFDSTPWLKGQLTTLLNGLFDPEIDKITINKTHMRAACEYKFRDYLNLILQEQIPPLHSSHNYREWFRFQFTEGKEYLRNLLEEEALKQHKDSSADWQDDNEYNLWDELFDHFNSYSPEQQRELLEEYLKALPRFMSLETETFKARRFKMACRLGQCVNENPDIGTQILTRAWVDLPNAMLSEGHNTDVLLSYRDAMLVCATIGSNSNIETLTGWAHEVLWKKFNDRYLTSKRPLQADLPTPKDLVGSRRGAILKASLDETEVKQLVLHTFSIILELSAKQTEQKITDQITDWLFKVCWGEDNPQDDQISWWCDLLIYISKKENGHTSTLEQLRANQLKRLIRYSSMHRDKISSYQDKLNMQSIEKSNTLDKTLQTALNSLILRHSRI